MQLGRLKEQGLEIGSWDETEEADAVGTVDMKTHKFRPVSRAERGWSVKRVLIYCSEAIQKAPWELRSSRMRTTENEEKENLDLTSFR